jgi:hypothetical protein|tara:strand:+ start:211 stop:765 length:555 start_codon:yes stop_codon:yes gene_type:complete
MIGIKITKDMIEQCIAKAEAIGRLKNSIRKGEGNLAGTIGEYVVHQLLENSQWTNTYDYDLIDDSKKIDVKTKVCSSKPLDFYECSIAATSTHQDCDEYIFVRILEDNTIAWVLGSISQKEYFKKSTIRQKGDKDKSNNFIFKADCYNLSIDQLNKLEMDVEEPDDNIPSWLKNSDKQYLPDWI